MIGVVSTSYPRSPDDYAGSFVRTRVQALVAAGESVEVIAAGEGGEERHGRVRVFRIAGAGIAELFYAGGAPEALAPPGLRLTPANPGLAIAPWLEAFHFVSATMALVSRRAAGWSRIESHWLLPSALIASAAAPHLVQRAHAHGGDVFLLGRVPGGAALARFLCREGTELVFASADLRARFARLCVEDPETLGARTCVQPAPHDPLLFRPRSAGERQRLRARFGLERFTVLAAGRLVPIKGFDVLVRALGHQPARVRPALVIAGAGPEKARLVRLAAACQVDLRLLGAISPATLADWMAAADLFVHPCHRLPDGRSEGAPLVVREALATGLPVVASADGGLPDLAGRERLKLVVPGAVISLAAEIRLALI